MKEEGGEERKGSRYFYLDRKEFALVGKVWVIELDHGCVRSVRRGQRLSVAVRGSRSPSQGFWLGYRGSAVARQRKTWRSRDGCTERQHLQNSREK